ncbi:FtsW/RodA/SpoVE family cell cycle protein [Bifidobacterium choloepi]|uniref:FtsW/RodA/SpoVE family cell cycle protein n=1 Tax=Bifidobacterium choloepi TaxID=2614131 RepID=A0A6I5N1U4_9BIFI|nr:FtsW/RodA/SpoVE family cell cycle protein [Bifidobacterium choloepi]NEG70587.1 FtsW/RodA/SpoVE family cell cycle protein [Bifidobacterium choloepi]
MMARQIRYLFLLLLAVGIGALGFFQMFERTATPPTGTMTWLLIAAAVMFLVSWALVTKFQPYANQAVCICAFMLTALGVLMIARIDRENDTAVAERQLMWLLLALVGFDLLVVFMRDYRVLKRFSYVSMVIGLVLLLSPMVPGLGREANGSRIWIGIGPYSLQPSEFAKLFLAFFFAGYLFSHRDQLSVGGKKVLGLRLPRLKDLGPIIVVWVAAMGVLILQKDLGTSLMFFAMFVAMLYVATDRPSWLVIGGLAFAVGCVVAAKVFAHVGYRVDAWLHPFDSAIYGRAYGSSYQLVTGIFGLANGGLTGTGLGNGYPAITPLANSDFIFSSIGEELGLAGVFVVLVLYLLIVAIGLLASMKIKDGFGKLLASGLAFTMAFQVFTVVGGITLVIPLTGLTLPFMAAGGSSLVANYLLVALLVVVSNAANKPEADISSDTFQMEAVAALQEKNRQRAAAVRQPRSVVSAGTEENGENRSGNPDDSHDASDGELTDILPPTTGWPTTGGAR